MLNKHFINNRPIFYQLIFNKNTIFMMIVNQRLQRQFDGLLMLSSVRTTKQ